MCLLIIGDVLTVVAFTGNKKELEAASKNNNACVVCAITGSDFDEEGEVDDETKVFIGSHPRAPMRITRDQEETRSDRNFTRRNIGIGKRKAPKESYQYKTNEMITVTRCEKTITKCYCHDSHGKHGRKPRNKDHRLEARGKAAEMRAKHRLPTIDLCEELNIVVQKYKNH